jgi:UDP-glucose:(heptosyl)LPS alpha-1,3-glucosyltransferase
MKIALTFPGCHRRGGIERVVLECARYLQRRGHQVTLFANDWDAAALQSGTGSKIEHQHVPMQRKPAFLAAGSFHRRCSAMLDPKEFDAISTHGCVSPLGGVQWVHSVHRAWLEYSKQFRRPLSMGRIKQRLNPLHGALLKLERLHFTSGNYQKLIAISPSVRDDLMRFYGVQERDIELIPNGYADGEFNLDRAGALRDSERARLGYRPGDRVVLFVANELERKGFGPLIRALAAINDPQSRLLVVGRVDISGYAAEIQKLGLTDRIQAIGAASDVVSYYAAADVFALPTQYEAWGLVIVEALACGKPVLTSRLAGAAEVVREGQTGELLDNPADVEEIAAKLQPLLHGNHASADAIACSVSAYTWNAVLSRYENLLEEQSGRAVPVEPFDETLLAATAGGARV